LDQNPSTDNKEVNFNLFNKLNGHDKKELYKKIFKESLETLLKMEKDREGFRNKLKRSDESYRTKTILAVILGQLIRCIGHFEHY
jgi:flagellar motor protein MotB